MSVTRVLLDILVVLVAAKVAAELAERVRMPAVVGEILAGVVVGPSVLGLVHGGEVLHVLGEVGVILLLLEVGMEMDIRELGAVGRASLMVAVVGVTVPFAAGYGVGLAFSMTSHEALFVAAAMTATSVGITARVFGDLRALATVEARTVLGAAVADDVMGLVILTVVVRLVSEGSVSLLGVLGVVGVAVAFLVVTSVAGVRLAPGLFALVERVSRSSGTLVAMAFAFTLALAELASAAQLAPIVGAFVAGLSLGRSTTADRIRRELAPVGHLFIPVFFLQIGIDAEVREFLHPSVLGLAGVLLAVAIVGKLVSAAGMLGSPGDRLLVGLGMIPRGEVGLIFATLGLRSGVFGQDVYAALLLVVLATTLLSPPALRWRLLRVRRGAAEPAAATPRPPSGWLHLDPDGGVVDLAAVPPAAEALAVALDAALAGDHRRPGSRLLDWLGSLPDEPLPWDAEARDRFFALLEWGGPRAWRFVSITGVLGRALPELADALARRHNDPFELDPIGAVQWPRLTRAQQLEGRDTLRHPGYLLLAAVLVDATEGDPGGPVVARRVAARLGLDADVEAAVAGLVADAGLLRAASLVAGGATEEKVLQIAAHLGSVDQARALYLLTLAANDLDELDRHRLAQLAELVEAALSHPELTGRDATSLTEQRRAEARALTLDPEVQERIDAAPRGHVLSTSSKVLAEQATLCEPLPPRGRARCGVHAVGAGRWRVDVVTRDRVGLLAWETAVLAAEGLDVEEALVATWGDGAALASFEVVADAAPDPGRIEEGIAATLGAPLASDGLPDVAVEFDDASSPWNTVCLVAATNRRGLLHAVTAAFATAGASIHSARVVTVAGAAADRFELTEPDGQKLRDATKDEIRRLLAAGVTPRGRFGRRRRTAPASATGHLQA